ncbi:MAG: histidine--tRNA ligase [Clostridia bacterium]|nr:histidine--tRNA ligase [Clostridia bacterium]
MFQKPKGTVDILPEETAIWHKIEEVVRECTKNAGFREIRIPTFELSGVYKRGVGDTTDIVQKEMFTLNDREGTEFCLRPEGTAGVVRSVIENGLFNEPMPLKLYYLGPFFRYEKPQAGRSREFYQFGIEMFGAETASADAEVIALGDRVIKKLGLRASLNINSIGCPDCRPKYHDALRDYFKSHENELCGTCKERLEKNPLRILDCKSPICSAIADNAPKTIDHLCDDCNTHFETLKSTLDSLEIEYSINPRIVRGLDYYRKTVFEFISDDIGAQSTVCGGGRYDGLVQQLDGPELCGIGFGMGLTRIVLAMKSKAEKGELELPKNPSPVLYIAPMGDRGVVYAMKTVTALRERGIYAECDVVKRSLKAQMKYADKIGAKYVLVVGDNELDEGKAMLKNMADRDDSRQVELDKVAADTSILSF